MPVVEKIIIEGDSKSAVNAYDNVTDAAEQTQEASSDVNESISSGFDAIDAKSGGAISAFKSLRSGLKSVVGGFKTLKGAIIATGIGALLIAVTSLVSYFTRTERGAQKLRVIIAGLQAGMDSLADVVTSLGEGLFKLFTGDFKGAIKTVKDGLTGIGEEIKNDVRLATELERAMNAVVVSERELISERARANKEAAEAKLIAEDINRSIEERRDAIIKVGQIEQKVTDKELETAQERLRVLEAQGNLAESDEEFLQTVEEARARVFDLETANFAKRTEFQAKLISLKNEEIAKEKELSDIRRENLKEMETKVGESMQKIADSQSELSGMVQRQSTIAIDTTTDTVAKQSATVGDYVNFTIANADVLTDAMANVAYALGGENKLGKAIMIARAVIDTYGAATTALAGSPPPFNFIAAAGVTAAGIANVNAMRSTRVPTTPDQSVPTPTQTISTPSLPPRFNIVGGSGINQLAQTIGSQFDKPLRAYVVGGDVSSSQELQRRRIRTATFG